MEQFQQFTQAYTQAPWRKQLQLIGAFLLVLIVVWIVAAVYLDVTARAAAIGREIQEMQVRTRPLTANTSSTSATASPDGQPVAEKLSLEELKQNIAGLETQLAYLTSEKTMEERAKNLGFEAVSTDQILYIEVPGYIPRQEVQLAPPPGPTNPSAGSANRPAPQTLLEWLQDQASQAGEMLQGVQP
jgi:hypothetical protein